MKTCLSLKPSEKFKLSLLEKDILKGNKNENNKLN